MVIFGVVRQAAMKTSNKTNDILKALDRNEGVTVLYHGKAKGITKPARKNRFAGEHTLSSNMRSGDAVIAATAVENNMMPVSGNMQHFKIANELQPKGFWP